MLINLSDILSKEGETQRVEAMVDMEMCLRLESIEAMGAVSTMVISPKTGIDMMKAVRAGASSMRLPR